MSGLINDVLNFSRLGVFQEDFVATDLNAVLQEELIDFELLIEQKQAVVTCGALPSVKAIPHLMGHFSGTLSATASNSPAGRALPDEDQFKTVVGRRSRTTDIIFEIRLLRKSPLKITGSVFRRNTPSIFLKYLSGSTNGNSTKAAGLDWHSAARSPQSTTNRSLLNPSCRRELRSMWFFRWNQMKVSHHFPRAV